MNASPPPLPKISQHSSSWRIRMLGVAALTSCIMIGFLIALRLLGLVCPYGVPTGSMTPAISAGDHVGMEALTFLVRKPRRGDIVVFKSDGLRLLSPATRYMKRIVGEPGEHLQITNRQILINNKLVALDNALGKIIYDMPKNVGNFSPETDVVVPENCYFLLGDNSTNSLDSRFFGTVPRSNITGRIVMCYWPPNRAGIVK